MTVGALLALVVLVLAIIFVVLGRLEMLEGGMIAALALAILLTVVPLPWRVAA